MTASDPETLEKERYRLLFDVRRSTRYHMRRAAFFQSWNSLTAGLGVVFGSATVGTLMTEVGKNHPMLAGGLAMVVTAVTAVDLVVGTSRMAWLHSDLRRRFMALELKIEEPGDMTPGRCHALKTERSMIEAEEPAVMRALDTICYNDLVQAMGQGKYAREIPWYERLTAHFVNWQRWDGAEAAK